jgi:Cd2+/Zn2+-exporting ATPase
MDCAEEVEALRREVGPVVGGAQRLSFDLMAGQMSVDVPADEVSDEEILIGIRRAGLAGAAAGGGEVEIGWWQRRGRMVMTTASGVFTLLGVLLHGLSSGSLMTAIGFAHGAEGAMPLPARIAYFLAVICGAWFIAPRAIRSARTLRPDMNLLMTVAVIGAILIGEWLEAATVAFLFAVSLLLESWSVTRARRAVQKLMDLAPPFARVRDRATGAERRVSPDEVAVGEIVVVQAGERIPLDGAVVEGASLVDASPVTGESKPEAIEIGGTVFAGTIALDGTLVLEVTHPASDTVLARIIRQVAEAGRRRAKAERWVDRFALIYTPVVFAAAVLTAVIPPVAGIGDWSVWFYRALVLLVIGCPCALVISTPVSVVAGLAAAARNGVLVKGGDLLEIPGRLATVALDKTGTLTTGRPEVVEVVAADDHTPEEVLAVAAALELRTGHPLGEAIVKYSGDRGIAPMPADDVRTLPGRGIEGTFEGRSAWLGSHRLLEERDQETGDMHGKLGELARGGRTVVVVGREDHVCGFIALSDTPRADAAETVDGLRALGIKNIAMLTGDNPETAAEIARLVGIENVHAGLLPADKVARLEDLKANGPLAFVGDGINDAPALALADIGIAMGGAGTDAAIETAHVALMADDLGKIPWLVNHSRKMLRIIRANITFALGVKAVFVILTFAGHASLWAAISADMGASLLVIANGLRLLGGRDGGVKIPGNHA